MTNTKRNNNEKQKYFMFHIIQDMIIGEYWTVDYCSYLVEQFEKIYPEEQSLVIHLNNNLKILKNNIGG